MPRRRIADVVAEERASAAASIARAVAPKVGRKSRPRMRALKNLGADVARMRASGDWGEATVAHVVEAYCWFHLQVYGVRPPELDQTGKAGNRERLAAISAARSLLEKEFHGRVPDLVVYLRWAWVREEGREKWAREKKIERTSRLGWRFLFSGRAVYGDYVRAAAARARTA